jgi:hypothetical protein
MTLGELLSDSHRVARLPVRRRWVVELLGDRLRGYLTRLANRYPITWPTEAGAQVNLAGSVIGRLPETARNVVGEWRPGEDVVGTCATVATLPGNLTLLTLEIGPLPSVASPTHEPDEPAPSATGTAREQFLAAAYRLQDRTGRDTFRRQDLIDEVVRTGTTLSLNTLGQMITTNLCVEPSEERWGKYADFKRVGHGLFQLREPSPRSPGKC